MTQRPPALPPALLVLWASAWIFLGTGGCLPVSPPNVPLDTDQDGLPDWVLAGDFDGDGVREMDDLQDAMDALSDPGPKLLNVESGSYAAPSAPASRPGRTHALLELRSYTTLACASGGATILNAGAPGAGRDYAVVANDDHVNGNDAVRILGCSIDGGMPDSYQATSLPLTRRMGVYFRRTRDSQVTDSYVYRTGHTGLYTSNSSRDRFLRNVVEEVGGWGDTTATFRQPCIYLFAFGGGQAVSDFVASDNTLRRCGWGLNTRAEHTDAPGDVIRNLLWERNVVEEAISQCISLRGVDGATVRSLTCRASGAIALHRGFASGYRSSGDDNANSDVLIEDAAVENVGHGQAGLDVGAWVDGLTVRRLRVEGTYDASGNSFYSDCAWLQRPLRNALLEDIELRECGKEGMLVTSLSTTASAAETLTLRRLQIAEVDQAVPLDTIQNAALHIQGVQERLLLEDLDLSGATGAELRFDARTSNTTLRRVTIDSVDPGWIGAFSEASAPACNLALLGAWITSLNGTGASDCNFSPGTTGATPTRCGCLLAGWGPIPFSAAPGIEFPAPATHTNVVLEDVTVANARGVTGVRVRGTLSAFSVTNILGLDDSLATDLPQRSAIDFDATTGWSVSGATCIGTQPGVPCIE